MVWLGSKAIQAEEAEDDNFVIVGSATNNKSK